MRCLIETARPPIGCAHSWIIALESSIGRIRPALTASTALADTTVLAAGLPVATMLLATLMFLARLDSLLSGADLGMCCPPNERYLRRS